MSKLFTNKKYYIKPSNLRNSSDDPYINQSMQNIIDSYSKNVSDINSNISSFNKNNVTMDYQKHYSPTTRSPVSLPPIQVKNRHPNNSQNRSNNKKLSNSNTLANLYSQNLFDINAKNPLHSGKTKANLLESNEDKNKLQLEKLNSKITQINNITNINIHIYRGNSDKDENEEGNDISQKNDEIYNGQQNYINENINSPLLGIKQNPIKKNNESSSLLAMEGMYKNNINPYNKKKRMMNGNIKILPSSGYSKNYNKNSWSMIGSMIMNESHQNKISQRALSQRKKQNSSYSMINSLPELKSDRSISNKKIQSNDKDVISLIKKENNAMFNSMDLENIDISMNFLKDLTNNNANFVSFLQLIQIHMDIELLLDNNESNGSNYFRKKLTYTINSDKIAKLTKIINNYFEILKTIYFKDDNLYIISNVNKANPIDNFFLYQSLNIIFHKIFKIQMCLFCAMLITLSQLGIYEINTMTKNHFRQIIKEISSPLLNLFNTFIKEEINLNYPELITINLRPDFNEHFNKLHKIQKFTQNYKSSDMLNLISKNLEKSLNSLKYYSTLNLKFSTIKPFGDALNQLLLSIDKKSLSQFASIILSTLLFGELNLNKNKALENSMLSSLNLSGVGNVLMGSSMKNKARDFPPFLPEINKKYKYTLVLDMDETLIHYFFTNMSGMFFVRPHCLEFLNELNDMYEIVTFTAGTKEYADHILNILDYNNCIIKYRLYRNHMTITGLNYYKDLSRLGRDLSKVIIIDNFKENFKMQPNNGIFIKTWTNDINDIQFKDILKILKDIISLDVKDVRTIIQKMNEQIKIGRNIVRPYSNINIAKLIT